MKEVEINGKSVMVVSTVDAVGLFCPLPVVKLKIGMEKLKLNEIVELLADDSGVLEDLPTYCRETNQKLLSLGKNKDDIFVAYVEKQTE